MPRKLTTFFPALVIFIAGGLVTTRIETVHGQGQPGAGFAAVPGTKGGWDLTGPYDVVRDWPKPMSQLPGHENWGWGAVEGVFAESPNRVFIVQSGELPVVKRSFARARAPIPNSWSASPHTRHGSSVPLESPRDVYRGL
jgi:hypothetical protein